MVRVVAEWFKNQETGIQATVLKPLLSGTKNDTSWCVSVVDCDAEELIERRFGYPDRAAAAAAAVAAAKKYV